MSQRERQASGGVSAVLPSLPEEHTAGSGASPSHPADKGSARIASWEELFRSASPTQQAELLHLARTQGVLYTHRLPLLIAGSRPESAGELTGLAVLTRLLAGKVDDLHVVRPAEVTWVDASLDERQRDAVAKALTTPDVCLIQGLPGTGKSRVAAEILTQAALRGERALFLAPTTAALDRVLETIADRSAVCALRALGNGEAVAGLSAAVRAMTPVERGRILREETLPAARQACAAGDQRRQRRGREEAVWAQLLDLAATRARLEEQVTTLDRRGATLAGEVADEAAGIRAGRSATAERPDATRLARALDQCNQAHSDKRRRLEAGLAEAGQKRAAAQEGLDALAAQREALRPLAQAKRGRRWWSLWWWRATFQGKVLARAEAVETAHRQAAETLARLEEEVRQAAANLQQAEEAFEQKCRHLEEKEVRQRQEELADQQAALHAEQARLDEKWRQVCAPLSPDVPRPEAPTPAAVQQAQERWRAAGVHDDEARALAQQWAAYLEESADDLAARLPGYANVVAAPLTALSPDGPLGAAGNGAGLFDLLVLEEADRITEADLLRAARHARRWVLIGEPAGPEEPVPQPSPGARARFRPRPTLPAGCFQRLWGHLHCDPSRLPYVWARENDRLCCRLYPVPADQRHRLESESVADFPEVELRILNLPRATPVLAEVVFPPTISIQEAKTYIYRELQELPVQALGRSTSWTERAEAVVCRLCACDEVGARPVPLEDGVREVVASEACIRDGSGPQASLWHTCRLEFDRSQGWERQRAEDWVRRYLRLRDLGRAVCLETLYRMTPPLAAVLSDLLWQGAGLPAVGSAALTSGPFPALEFVAVPPLDRRAPRDRARAGAGLEVDLSGPRRSDRLPTDLRTPLPAEGLVNYLEAQAVVRRLSRLVADPAFRAAGREPVIAVIALYPAQVTLLREMIRRANLSATCGRALEVGLPDAFRHRECLTTLVSLTRSHTHRAVPFGHLPEFLPLALTRPQARLIVFGDVGTLTRRVQWQGPLDHLDEQAAARECRLLAGLLRYIQGQGRHAASFRLSEGDGP